MEEEEGMTMLPPGDEVTWQSSGMDMRAQLDVLAARARHCLERARAEDGHAVVEPSMPVLYFGNSVAYAASPLRVITVGLNPSGIEFPAAPGPWVRFPKAASGENQHYLDALDAYFTTSPYRAWFNSYEPLLQGLGASYYPGAASTALHTDIATPVATDPTWSKLTKAHPQSVERLGALGTPLWHDLVVALRPDVIVLSVAEKWLDELAFEKVEDWHAPFEVATSKGTPFPLLTGRLRITSDHVATAVWGRAAQTPLGVLSKPLKRATGERLARVI